MWKRAYSFASVHKETKWSVNASAQFPDLSATCSPQQAERRLWQPTLPKALRTAVVCFPDQSSATVPDGDKLAQMFPKTWGQSFVKFSPGPNNEKHSPLRVGVVLSGGQAAGGHNVIAGLFDHIKQLNPQSQLIGFLSGPQGIFTHNYREITDELMAKYRNMGGFDMICSGRHKIETEEQKRASMDICQKLDLHGLVIIGGDDSNTNGAILAEYFAANGCNTKVIGAPKTIDGDLKNDYVEVSFGFDTACKVYSELIGNLCTDAATSMDRYHFVRLMGRSASNIALECALQTRANLTFIGEEVEKENRSLKSICDEIVDMVIKREEMSKPFGVILIPEGLIEFIPEFGVLIGEINEILAKGEFKIDFLTDASRKVFSHLPEMIRAELLLERDAHGNVQVSRIALEELLVQMVTVELKRRDFQGRFIPTCHFFGYEGRCAMPSNFDANYCYALGHTAAALIDNNMTGYMAVVRNLHLPVEDWIPAGCPITIMMNIERRKGKDVPVIKKYLVELDKALYLNFKKVAENWKYRDLYRNPGPIQFEGPIANACCFMLAPPNAPYLLPNIRETNARFPKSLEVMSPLQVARLRHRAPKSNVLMDVKTRAVAAKRCAYSDTQVERFVRRIYPLQVDRHANRAYAVEPCEASHSPKAIRIGAVLAGQPIPGATNVIEGLFERLQLIGGKLIGFKGVTGLLTGDHIIVDAEELSLYVNQGGFELLGRTAETKHELRNNAGLALVSDTCQKLDLDGLVLIGGQTSLTDAAVITEYFLVNGIETRVVGVPANQENNTKHDLLEAAIGFDTTSKSYSSLIGNLMTDAASARKYWYFVRVMGNVPSHIVLETALQTHPNFTVVSERYVQENMSLHDVVRDIADVVSARAAEKKNFGAVIIPEGVVRAIPQYKALLDEIDTLLAKHTDETSTHAIRSAIVNLERESTYFKSLTPWSAALLTTLPEFFRAQLVKETPTGRIELSEIAAEQLLANWVGHELQLRKKQGLYNGSFAPICHYFGFQGRSAMPSNFDCALGVAHGYLASILIESDLTGFVTSVRGLCRDPQEWRLTALPVSVLLRIMPDSEVQAYGRPVPMIPCADVDLNGSPYNTFAQGTEIWEGNDSYCNPGPIQYFGPAASYYNRTLYEEQFDYISMLAELEALLNAIGGVCSFGVNKDTLKTAVLSMGALANVLADTKGAYRH